MAVREQPVCSDCGKDINPEPDLWDRQGQPVHIKFAAYTVKLDLCSDCLKKLDRYRGMTGKTPGGAVPPSKALPYMPFKE